MYLLTIPIEKGLEIMTSHGKDTSSTQILVFKYYFKIAIIIVCVMMDGTHGPPTAHVE